jgi:prophage antirepressor-like protein
MVMATQIVPFAFEDQLVRSVQRNGEPWFVGKDVCAVLDIAKHHQALDRLDADERGTCSVGTPSGDQDMIVVSEPGVFRLIFTSRKPQAERFKRWLAHEVLPQIRRTGRYGAPAPAPDPVSEPLRAVEVKLQMVRVAQGLHGLPYARKVWAELGLSAIMPAMEPAPDAEARACLMHLLDAAVDDSDVASLMERALDEDVTADLLLRPLGLRALLQGRAEIIWVANHAAFLRDVFEDTPWANGSHARVLKRLPGAEPSEPRNVAGRITRGVTLPGNLLDRASLTG